MRKNQKSSSSNKMKKTAISLILIVTMMFTMIGCANDVGSAGNQTGATEKQKEKTNEDDGKSSIIDGAGLFARKDDNTETEGRWVEKEISPCTLGQIVMSPVKMNDGSYVFYGKKDSFDNNIVKFTSTDLGETWSEEELGWEQKTESTLCP